MKKMASVIISLFLGTTLASCSLFEDDGLISGNYEGLYSYGFEVSSFTPCDRKDEEWWVVVGNRAAHDSLFKRYRSAVDQYYTQVFVELKGKPGKKGKYGHLGGYDRKFAIQEFIELRDSIPDDCN